MIVNLFSPDGSRDNLYLSNYATIQFRDELARLPGVGDITYLGQRDYSMRLWLDPEKMAVRNLTASDVVAAIQQQNAQVAAGQIGQPPVPKGQVFQYTMTTLGRLAEPEQFDDMILKTDAARPHRPHARRRPHRAGRPGLRPDLHARRPALGGAVDLPAARLQRAEGRRAVKAKMKELKKSFPDGLDYAIVYDTTPFITESIQEVVQDAAATRCCWWRWWCCCFCRTGGRRSFRWWPCPWPSSAPSR